MKKQSLLIAGLFICTLLFSQTKKENYPKTVVADSAFKSVNWSSPSSAADSDGVYSTVTVTKTSPVSSYLEATGFGFTLPLSATIDGITAEVDGNYPLIVQGPGITSYVKLTKAGILQSDSISSNALNTSDSWASFGGCSNLWNNTFAASEINNSGFGLAYSAIYKPGGGGLGGNGPVMVSIDAVRITVCYTTSTGTQALVQSSQTRTVYPNPTSGSFYLSNEGKYQVIVFDELGNESYKGNLDGPQKLDLSFLASGIYYLTTLSESSSTTQKLVKTAK